MALREADPEWVGGYRLLDRLGSGGMGTVYLAQAESGRLVAVKVVHQQYADDFELRTRFRQEIAAARRVSGAFTAPVVDADAEAPRPWMATAYVLGDTLSARVRDRGPLAGAELRRLAVGLVEALRDMHKVGVIHRDLKPDNVLLTEEGPLVIDFGISRAADHQTLTVTGRILGTPPYMSPEQLSAPHKVTPASDIFSLGAVLVFAAAGHGPFDSESHYLTAYNVVHEPPGVGELSGTVREIVQWCLAKEPAERPGLADLLEAFRTAPASDWGLRPHTLTTPARDVETDVSRSRWRPGRRTILAVAMAVVTAAAVGTWTMGGWKPEADKTEDTVSAKPPERPKPAVEQTAALRPAGWGLWTVKADKSERFLKDCAVSPLVLLCHTSFPGAGGDARLVAYDTGTGRRLWGDAARGDVAILGFSPSSDLAYLVEDKEYGGPSPSGRVRAITPTTGATAWTSPKGSASTTETPVLLSDKLVTRTIGGTDSDRFHAWSLQGKHLWTVKADFSERLYASRGHLYAAGASDRSSGGTFLRELDVSSGTEIRSRKFTGASILGATPDGVLLRRTDGALYLGALGSDAERATTLTDVVSYQEAGGRLYGIDETGTLIAADGRTGKRLWSTKVSGRFGGHGFDSTLHVSAGRVYAASSDEEKRIMCFDGKDGTLIWTSAPRHDDVPEQPALDVGAGGIVYAKSGDTLHALKPPK